MNVRPVTEWALYRLRFVITYTLVAVLVLALIGLFIDRIPGGLGPSEAQSAISSSKLSFTELPSKIIDLPYHALQKLSLEFFGLSPLGVRLPSLVFGALTAWCLALILRRWFQPHIAVVATIIVLTSAWFLSVSRLGAPLVMVPFWTSLLMLAATYSSQQTPHWKAWKVIFGLAAALSLYTPYMAYLFSATLLASFSQPHLRYLIRESSKIGLTIGTLLFAILLVPLGWGIYKDPSAIREILAIPASIPDPIQFAKDLWQAIMAFANPFHNTFGETIAPALSVTMLVLLALGTVRLLSDFHSVRAHLLLIWAGLLVPVIGLTPGNITVLFVPATLVISIGLNQIIRYWYRLFPRNPYARFFGLIPLAILMFTMVSFNYDRYVYGTMYSQQATATFKPDAFLAQRKAAQLPADQPLTIVVSAADQPLYQLIANERPRTAIVNPDQTSDASGTWLVAQNQINAMVPKLGKTPTSVIVTERAGDPGLAFWVYQR